MLKRAAITVAVWLVCLAFLTTNGQHFTHGLAVLLSTVLGAAPWVSLLRRQHSARQRFAAVAVVAASAIVAIKVSLHLPKAYAEQQRINPSADAAGPARPSVTLTAGAAQRLRQFLRDEGRPMSSPLRASAKREGPTGFTYDLVFDDEIRPGDLRTTSGASIFWSTNRAGPISQARLLIGMDRERASDSTTRM